MANESSQQLMRMTGLHSFDNHLVTILTLYFFFQFVSINWACPIDLASGIIKSQPLLLIAVYT